jgi:uncharacterized protein YndB with AHSA1/START domain/uncharacterized protein YciI
MKGLARAVADTTEGVIFATVDIAAPVERVFQALTSSEDVVRWWGSQDTYRTTEWIAEVRTGGRWQAKGVSADGSTFTVGGEYLEVDAPRRLVQTWKPSWDPGPATTLTYRLEGIDGGTRLHLRHEGFGDRAEACQQHTEGWELVFGWLRRHFTPSTPASKFFLIKLRPPRATFAVDMTAAEREVMMQHVAYWTKQRDLGKAVVFGPVMDPAGGWGAGIVELASRAEVQIFEAEDPALLAKLGMRYEVLEMPSAIARPRG